MAFSDSSIGFGFLKMKPAINPPITTPATKTKFHISAFQSYLKNFTLPGTQAAQKCRRDEEIPNDLLPKIRSKGIINPINGPAMYHGHGFNKSSVMFLVI